MDDSGRQISNFLSLEKAKGLQCLMNEAYNVLGNPIVLFNMEYELLFCAKDVVTDDWLWNEIVKTGVFSEESIKFFSEECFIDTVANTKSVVLLASDKLKYDRLYGRIFNQYNNTVANLIMVGCNKPFETQDVMAFEGVCKELSREIGTSDSFKHYGILYDEKLIGYLLDAHISNKVIYAGHLSNLYKDLKTNLYVVVADVKETNAAVNGLEALRDSCKEMQPELKYAIYANYLVVIASTDEAALNHKKDLHKLSRYFNEHTIRTGISSRFENLFNLRKYYDEAVQSLNDVR